MGAYSRVGGLIREFTVVPGPRPDNRDAVNRDPGNRDTVNRGSTVLTLCIHIVLSYSYGPRV